MLPFADTPEPGTTWQIVVAGLAGGVLTKAIDFLVTLVREGRKEKREDKSDTLSRMERLLDRAEVQQAAQKRETDRAWKTANKAIVRAERAVMWIKHLESKLREAGIEFDAWVEVDGDSQQVFRPGKPPQEETEVGE